MTPTKYWTEYIKIDVFFHKSNEIRLENNDDDVFSVCFVSFPNG